MEPGLTLLKLNWTSDEDRSLPYQSLVGRLCYLAHSTWPNITFAVNVLSQHLATYLKAHWAATKHLLCYLQGTINHTIQYNQQATSLNCDNNSRLIPQVYCDTDWGGDINTHHSMTRIICTLLRSPVYWSSKLQHCITLSTCKAEYNTLAEATKQAIYLHDFCNMLHLTPTLATVIYNNYQATLKIVNSQPGEHHPQLKHYTIKLAYLHNLISNSYIKLHHHSSNMPTNMLTKAVSQTHIIELLRLLNMFNSSLSIKGRVEEHT